MIAITKAVVLSFLILIATVSHGIASDNTQFNNSHISYSPVNSFGLGFGLGFGGAGISYDREIRSRVVLTTAIGNDREWAAGAKVRMRKGKIWQPRLSFLYGTNTHVFTYCDFLCFTPHYESFEGFSAGVGQSFFIGSRRKHSIDIDIFYAVVPQAAKDLAAELDRKLPIDPIRYSLG